MQHRPCCSPRENPRRESPLWAIPPRQRKGRSPRTPRGRPCQLRRVRRLQARELMPCHRWRSCRLNLGCRHRANLPWHCYRQARACLFHSTRQPLRWLNPRLETNPRNQSRHRSNVRWHRNPHAHRRDSLDVLRHSSRSSADRAWRSLGIPTVGPPLPPATVGADMTCEASFYPLFPSPSGVPSFGRESSHSRPRGEQIVGP